VSIFALGEDAVFTGNSVIPNIIFGGGAAQR